MRFLAFKPKILDKSAAYRSKYAKETNKENLVTVLYFIMPSSKNVKLFLLESGIFQYKIKTLQ